jgi:hypothetical protein
VPGLPGGWPAGLRRGSIALIAGGMALAYVDRHLLSAGTTTWNFSDVLTDVIKLAIPVIGLSLRPGVLVTGSAGCSWRPAWRWA